MTNEDPINLLQAVQTITNEDPINLLRVVKERLFTTGWRKNEYGQKQGPNCILGALYLEVEALERKDDILDMFSKCKLYSLPEIRSIAVFNDLDDTTFDDVLDVIDRAIKSLESE